ncbi:MAG TPA: hypothetical protein DCP71_07530, partial [Verrucomicrobiales bacterium]|nr:hypothetical protein [Verrucomicrobiales bacterium]
MHLHLLLVALLCLPGMAGAESLQLTLPPTWHGVVGVPMSLYYDNVVLTEHPEQYRFSVQCPVGATGERAWSVKAP